jgi:hypothetical protein
MAAYNRCVNSSRRSLFRWPLPALFAWSGSWLLYGVLLRLAWPLWLVISAATVAGVLLSVMAGTFWRRIAIAAGFPLSLLLSGTVALPAWAWLLPLLLVALVYPMNAWRDAPLFPTPATALRELSSQAPLRDGALVLDAGCGLGHGLRALRDAYPNAQLHGIEWSWPLRALTALLCPWARIRQGDMWKADWSGYDMVYLFQRPESMPRAVDKARAELKPGAWLVSLEFVAEELRPSAKLQSVEGKPVWLYRAPFKAA